MLTGVVQFTDGCAVVDDGQNRRWEKDDGFG